MAAHTQQLKRRLGHVRRRWRITAAAQGLLLVLTEVIGLFLLYFLADLLIGRVVNIPGKVRLAMFVVGAVVLGLLFCRHVMYQLLRPIPDEQIALLIEERSDQAEGAVITALEVGQEKRKGLYAFIANFLVDDAVRRIDRSHVTTVSSLSRLRAHLIAAAIVLGVFGGTLLLPSFARRGERVVLPWRSIRQERLEAREKEEAAEALRQQMYEPITFEISPGDDRIPRGGGVNVWVRLSRKPADTPVLWYRSEGGQWKSQEMRSIEQLNSFDRPLPDIYEDMEYLVASSGHRSRIHTVTVYDPLSLRHIQLTYHFPEYLKRPPFTRTGLDGDVEALTGTRVDLKVVANNRLKAARITFDKKRTQAMTPGRKAEDGASASFVVDKDSTYQLALEDVDGQKLSTKDFFYVKALPDKPPAIEMAFPSVDMTIHTLCEVTFKAKVTDDYGVKDVKARVNYYRSATLKPLAFELKPVDAKDTTLPDGSIEYLAEHVWELEGHKPAPKVGDMMFYYFEVTDRKGQTARTDMFNIRLLPTEVVAAWPDEASAPDLPHWDYYRVPDLMLFIAAAWNIERQRPALETAKFNEKCEKLAERMAPQGEVLDFFELSKAGQAMMKRLSEAEKAIVAQADARLDDAHRQLLAHQPGKAAEIMTLAQAIVEGLLKDKTYFGELEVASEPVHTGQPSGGFADDPIQAQLSFSAPTLMSDSLTAFQQQDNPDHHLPPDYRRGLSLKKRTAALTKQLKAAGEIYASEEMLIEMAKETIGHLRLREAADVDIPNEVAAAPAGRDRMIRVDKRAIPYAKLDPLDAGQAGGEKPKLGKPDRKTTKALDYKKLKDNKRRGSGNPHRSQTAGGTGAEPEEQDPSDPTRKPPPKPEDLGLRPSRQQDTSAGGGGRQQPGQRQQSRAGAVARALADRQQGIAAKADKLARAVSRSMDPDDEVAKAALENLRGAARQMRSAEDGFRKGRVRSALTHAEAARRQMQRAMNMLKIGQYDNLEQALDAAQRGAGTLAQNQNRITRATALLASRVGELVGKNVPRPGTLARPGKGEPQPAKGKPQPGKGLPGKGQPQPGKGQPGKGQPQVGKGQPGKGQPTKGEPTKGRPGGGDEITNKDLHKAAGYDPRLGAQVRKVSSEQAAMAKDVAAFSQYVKDLRDLAANAGKQRVSKTIGDVADAIKSKDIGQSMIDTSITINRGDLTKAQTAQRGIERDIRDVMGELQAAGDLLSGSPTGVLARRVKTAKEIGHDVKRLAGIGRPGQGDGQPGKGDPKQPGKKGQPGKGDPTQPGKDPGKDPKQPGKDAGDLGDHLARGGDPNAPARPGGERRGGGVGTNRDIENVFWKTRRFARDLQRDELTDPATIKAIRRKVVDIDEFKRMFAKANKAKAGEFADVVLDVGKDLETALKEALSAKRLHAEQREEFPPKYRAVVNAYFEALSKAVAERKKN